MLMSRVDNRFDILVEMRKMSAKKKITDLIQDLGKLSIDEYELVSKSPMRTHEYSHSSKPYGHPQGSTSRSSGIGGVGVGGVGGGIPHIPEGDDSFQMEHFKMLHCHPESSLARRKQSQEEVDIRDIGDWLNMCSRNPQVINDFIAGCKEFDLRSESNNFACDRFNTLQQCKSDNLSICSNSSSQITSPAQSPSEENVLSPEGVSCEENSLYQYVSPIIPSIECINIKPGRDDADDIDGLLTGAGTYAVKEDDPAKCGDSFPDPGHDAKLKNTRTSASCTSSENLSPNIGTLMLNLAADSYESTIDLSQFTGTVTADVGFVYSAVEKELLNEKLDPKAKLKAWTRISQINTDSLGKGDKEGDTQLMILLVSEKVTLEYIYVIVERLLKENPSYLSCRNEINQDALYLAALSFKREPLVASYIAEAFVRGKQDVNKKYEKGNTLLHCLVEKGDSHAKVLERLLRLKSPENAPAFDINKKNNRGYTPLHSACKAHKPGSVHTYQTVKVLIENGADCLEKDYMDENTPLHTLVSESCDSELLRILLESWSWYGKKSGPAPTTVPNRQGNTVLHLACGRNSLEISAQKEIITSLLKHGAMIHLKNINGCVPSMLAAGSRKQEIKSSLHSIRQK